MKISVCICTWNRCKLLYQTLEQMTRLAIPPEVQWELLIVNNNSNDATNAVITSFSDRLPIRNLFEPRPGQSYARNQALHHCTGEYILWTDDDVLVDEEWLAGYCEAFRRWPDAILFGGRIEPWFSGIPPRWLHQILPQVSAAYALRDLGTQPVPLSPQAGAVPFGANFAIRASEQRRYLYDTCLGLKPNSSVRGEEGAVIRTMLEEGAHGWWVPTARVRHYIPQRRQTTRYLRSFYFGMGEGEALKELENSKAGFFSRPKWMWRAAIEAEFRYRLRRLLDEPRVWIEDLKKAGYWWGKLRVHALCPHQR